MIYIFLADGFEECEALIPLDILRRAGMQVKTVGIGSKTVTGAHRIPVICDITDDEAEKPNLQALILPGGMPGTLHLEDSATVQDFIDYAERSDILIGAICAAPSILGHKNLLNGKKATCYPGFEKDLHGAEFCDVPVLRDGNIITSCGAGAAFDFGFAILTALTSSPEEAEKLKSGMKYSK